MTLPPDAVSQLSTSNGIPPGPTLDPARFGIRAAARIIDIVIHMVVATVTSAFAGILLAIYAALARIPVQQLIARVGRTTFLGVIATLVAGVAFHTLAESVHGSSPGKRTVGITVRSDRGGRCSLGAALIRSLAFFLDGLFFGIPAAVSMQGSPTQQRLGDKWGHTVVVRLRSLPPAERPSALRFLVALLMAICAYSALFATGLLLTL